MKQSSTIYALTTVMAIIAAPQAKSLPTPSQRFGGEANGEVANFRKHVIPLLGVRGCNGRECHGSFSGKGGFQLSLFGYEFDKDHEEIVRDEDEIRVNRDHPENSLILMKPTGRVSHTGGSLIDTESEVYADLVGLVGRLNGDLDMCGRGEGMMPPFARTGTMRMRCWRVRS